MRWAILVELGSKTPPAEVDARDFPKGAFDDAWAIGQVPVCPACEEELFHAWREGFWKKDKWMEPTAYFSHYPMTPSSPECDLRVRRLGGGSLERVTREAVRSAPYLLQLQELMIAVFGPLDRRPMRARDRKLVESLAAEMKSGWYLLREIAVASPYKKPEEMLETFRVFAPFLVKALPSGRRPALADLRAPGHGESVVFLWRCLHIPREQPNRVFLLKLTLGWLDRHSVEVSRNAKRRRNELVFWAFGLLCLIPWVKTELRPADVTAALVSRIRRRTEPEVAKAA